MLCYVMLVIVRVILCMFRGIIVFVKKGTILITRPKVVMLNVGMECLFYRKGVMMGMVMWAMGVIICVTNNPTSYAKTHSTNNPLAD